MEHDARKMTALAILLLLLGAGVVGVGYAAFSGTASTYNEENSATAGYIYLDSTNWDSVSADDDILTSNTYTYHYKTGDTDGDYVAFYFESGATVEDIKVGLTDYKAVAIDGATKTYALHNATSAVISSVDFTSTAVNGPAADPIPAGNLADISGSDFKYIMKVTGLGDTEYFVIDNASEGVDTFTLAKDGSIAIDGSTDIVFQVYLGYAAEGAVYIPDSGIGRTYTAAQIEADGDLEKTDYEKMAHEVAKAQLPTKRPVDMNNINFAFSVKETAP